MESPHNMEANPNQPRLRHVSNHRKDCECSKCQQIARRADLGLPTKEEERQLKRKAREERHKQRQQQQPDAGSRKLRRLEQRAAIAASVATQVALGQRADTNLALRIAGVGATDQASKNEAIGNAGASIQAALARAGLTPDVIVAEGMEGMRANLTKFFAYEGKITDQADVRDWNSSHKYWHDFAEMMGMIRPEETAAPATGGLVIIMDHEPPANGHALNCPCAECLEVWRHRMSQVLSAQRRREAAANSIDVPEKIVPEKI